MTKETLKLALEALEGVLDDAPKVLDASIAGGLYEVLQCRDAITAIKAALAQPEQEPVGVAMADYMALTKKYVALKAQRTWVSLTDEEVGDLSDFAYANDEEFVRQVEKHLKEKNT